MNAAALLQGILNGLNYALLALGLVLVFRASRFVNVAHAQLGVASSLVLAKLVVDTGWPYWAAFALAVAVGAATAAAVEVLVIRRMESSSGLTLFIVSTGIAQVLLAVTMVDALRPDPQRIVLDGYPVPLEVTHEIGGFVMRGQHVFTLVLAPVVAAALALFLRSTMTGKAVRAVASNREAARLAGVPVRRIATSAWAVAGALSAVTAILQAPSQPVFSIEALGPGLLLRALAAAALAGFTGLAGAFAAGVGLGVVEGLLLGATQNGGITELVVFLAVVAGLVVRRRAFGDSRVGVRDAQPRFEPLLRIPAAIADRWLVRWQRPLLWGVAVLLGVALPFLPPLADEGDRFLLAVCAVYAIVAVSLTVLSGWSGQVSLGHFSIVGLGCFVSARLAEHGWSFGRLCIAAGLSGAVAGVLMGLPTVRSRGILLAVTSLGFALIASEWLFRQEWLGGLPGETTGPLRAAGLGVLRSQLSVYFASLVVLVLVLLATSALSNTGAGRALRAVRDNDAAAAAFGLSATRARLVALAVSGAIAGLAGVLWLAAWRTGEVARFGPDASFIVLALPAVGGLDSLAGAVLATIAVIGIPLFASDAIERVFSSSTGFVLLLSGLGLVLTQMQYPGGLAGGVRRRWQALLDRWAAGTGEVVAADQPSVAAAVPIGPVRLRADRPVVAAPAVSEPLLQVVDVHVGFGGVRALDGVSLEVRPGEIVGLIGANGAGKTTLFNVIAGVVEPDAGDVLLDGRSLAGRSSHHRARLGMARSFQDARLFPQLTVTETAEVALAGGRPGNAAAALAGWPSVATAEVALADRADEVLARFNLHAWSGSLVGTLSTGTRRVCDFAAQASAAPRLLLLDEPTAGIAQRDAEAFGDIIRGLRDDLGCAIVVVEHDLPMLLGVADRLYAMESGRVIATGTPGEVRDDPAVIASYLGTTPAAIERSRRVERGEAT